MARVNKLPVPDWLRSRLPKADKKALEVFERDIDEHNGKILLHADSLAALKDSPATSPELYAALQGSPLRQEAIDLAIAEAYLRTRAIELLEIFSEPIRAAIHEATVRHVEVRERVRKELTDHGVLPAGIPTAMVWHRSIRDAHATIQERRAAAEQLAGWRQANAEGIRKVEEHLERLKRAALAGIA